MKNMIDSIRLSLLAVWIVGSAIFYASMSLLLSPVDRRLAWRVSRQWSANLLFFFGVRIRRAGFEAVDPTQPYIFIANHQSAFDIPVLYAGIGQPVNFIAKKGLFLIPVFGWAMAAVGHIQMDRNNTRKARAAITRAGEKLRRDRRSLVLFPEGTRSHDGLVGDFKRGSFTLALEAQIPIVPVAIIGSRELLPKKSLRPRPGTVEIRVGLPIKTAGLGPSDKTELSRQVREAIMTMMGQAGENRPNALRATAEQPA